MYSYVIDVLKSFWSSVLDEDGMSTVTMWIAGDFETVSGRKLLLNALKHVVSMVTTLPILSSHDLACVIL